MSILRLRKRANRREEPLVGLDEKHEAHRRLRAATEVGAITEDEYQRRRQRVYQAVTPRDLWKASGGRGGSPRRSDWRAVRHAILLQIAIVIFAAMAMVVILYGTVLYLRQGGAP